MSSDFQLERSEIILKSFIPVFDILTAAKMDTISLRSILGSFFSPLTAHMAKPN